MTQVVRDTHTIRVFGAGVTANKRLFYAHQRLVLVD